MRWGRAGPRARGLRPAARPVRCRSAAGRRGADALRALAREQRTTLSTILMAIYGAFLHRISGQDDLLIGLPTIPLILILSKMVRWEDYLLRLWRKYSPKLPGFSLFGAGG